MMQAHYRSVLDFSNDALLASEKGFLKLMEAVSYLSKIEATSDTTDFDVLEWKSDCYTAMNDDFNTPILIAELFRAVKFINQIKDSRSSKNASSNNDNKKLGATVELLIRMRNEARSQKNFALSDQIRDELYAIGIQLKDGKEGTTFSLD